MHFECKRVESGSPYKWLDQAVRDGGIHRMPVVAHKRNGRDWLAIVHLDDLIQLLKDAGRVAPTPPAKIEELG